MKNVFIILLTIIISANINAQITIEASDLPQPNKSVKIAISDGYNFELGEASDIEQTWDFSFLPFVEEKEFLLQSPENFVGQSSFPNATMAQTTPFADVLGVSLTDLVTLPIQLPDANVFYGNNEDGSVNYQGIFANFDIDGVTDGDTASIALEPPFNYYPIGTLGDEINSAGSLFFKVPVDEGIAELILGTGFDLSQLGISVEILDAGITIDVSNQVNIDAFGTMITPKNEYDVVRFNETMFIDIKINAFLGALDLGQVYTTNAVVKQYRWWAKEQNHPVLTIVNFDEQGGTSTLSVEYINEEVEDVPEPTNIAELDYNFSVFPNPASDLLQIELKENTKVAQLDIFNTIGQHKLSSTIVKNKTIDVSNFSAGTYLLKLSTEKGTLTKVFIVE